MQQQSNSHAHNNSSNNSSPPEQPPPSPPPPQNLCYKTILGYLVEPDAKPFQLGLHDAFVCHGFGRIQHNQNQITCARRGNDLPPTTFAILGALNDTRQIEQLDFATLVAKCTPAIFYAHTFIPTMRHCNMQAHAHMHKFTHTQTNGAVRQMRYRCVCAVQQAAYGMHVRVVNSSVITYNCTRART